MTTAAEPSARVTEVGSVGPPRSVEIDPVEQAARAASDPARPRWHVTPPWGWLNDPNGLSVWPGPDGRPLVHLFYQHNSRAPVHEGIEWGHQYSEDLVHWTDLPVALTPEPDGPDDRGCWSGAIVADTCLGPDGVTRTVPTMVYSGASDGPTQTCCLATAVDGDPLLTRWVKDPANPVIDAAPLSTDGLVVPEMRDHCVWKEAGRWYQVMGSGLPGGGREGAQGGTALCFSSTDLRTWRFEGPLAVGDGDVGATGTVWECPDLFSLDGVDVLMVSAWHEERTMRSMWMTGRRAATRMEVEIVGRADLGENYFYAPQSVLMPDGRRVMIGWMQAGRTRSQRVAAGWAGSMSVPRQVHLAEDGTLRSNPVAEVALLRRDLLAHEQSPSQVDEVTLECDGLDLELSGRMTGASDEDQGGDLIIDVAVSGDGRCRTRLRLARREPVGDDGQDAWTGWLSLDRSASAVPGSPWECDETGLLSGPVPLGPDGEVELRLLLDRSSLEVFVGGQPLSARLGADPAHRRTVVRAAALRDVTLKAWTMGEAYDRRLDPRG